MTPRPPLRAGTDTDALISEQAAGWGEEWVC